MRRLNPGKMSAWIALALSGFFGGPSSVGAGQAPAAGAPAQATATPLSKFIPQGSLRAYLAFDGVDAHADAWGPSTTNKLLNDTTLGALFEDIITQASEQALASTPGRKLSGQDVAAILKHALKSGVVL